MTQRVLCSGDARAMARRRLPRLMFDFIDGAAGTESAPARNRAALDRICLMPRVLADVRTSALGTDLLGQAMGLPFGIAPMGMCNLAWPGADLMLAAEAVKRRIPHCLSTVSSTSLEEVRRVAGERAWFQLYVSGSTETAFGLADRAAACGYEVLVLTVDVPRVGRRLRDLRNGFAMPFRIGPRQFIDFASHPLWSLATLRAGAPAPANFAASGAGFNRHASRAGADWAFLDQLRSRWKGRLVVKGVLCPEDARRIAAAGADAVWVSNHGGRQLDSAPASITALGPVRDAVGAAFPLIFDGGVRSAEDVARALATGADFVMLGRPLLFAIGANGAAGLADLLDNLTDELAVTLAQLGLRDVRDIGRAALAPTLQETDPT